MDLKEINNYINIQLYILLIIWIIIFLPFPFFIKKLKKLNNNIDLKEKYLKLEYIKNIYLSKIVIWNCFFIAFDFVFLITQKIMLLTNNTFLFKIIWIKILTIYIGDNLIYPIYLITILFYIFKYKIKKNIEKTE